MNVVYIIIFVIILLLLFLFLTRKEKYLTTTYVNTPGTTGSYPTNVTDYYWYDRYIDQPTVNYSAVPYVNYGPGWRRGWRRGWGYPYSNRWGSGPWWWNRDSDGWKRSGWSI